MGNLTYQKAFRKQLKTSYKGFNNAEKRYLKAKERAEQLDKALGDFYSNAKRLENGAVNWKNMTEQELNYFDVRKGKSGKNYVKVRRYY